MTGCTSTSNGLRSRRVAVVHDWLTGRRGAEKVLEEILELVPHADVYTLVHRRGAVPAVEAGHRIHATWLSRLPFARRYFQLFFPWFNDIIRGVSLEGYDLVISLSHCVAKNVPIPRGVPHVCYCATPARYAWDLFDLYAEPWIGKGFGRLFRGLAVRIRDRWRRQDVDGCRSITRFLAISEFVRSRIRRCYNREADVLYPSADVEAFEAAGRRERPGERFLVVSAVRPNKRVAEIVQAFRHLGLPLDVVGAGSPRALVRLRALGGPNVCVHGEVSDAEVERLTGSCRALVHAATEDFGLVPVEAMAAGRPVIGYAPCGVQETVVGDGADRTGVLFSDPTPDGIAAAVRQFVEVCDTIQPEACRRRAARFTTERFREEFLAALLEAVGDARPGAEVGADAAVCADAAAGSEAGSDAGAAVGVSEASRLGSASQQHADAARDEAGIPVQAAVGVPVC